jgi:enamine deaminase RidA (YjgF/YER057c/UK114 family)
MTIQRLQEVKGLRRPRYEGRDVFSTVVMSSRKKMIFIAGQLAIDAEGNTVGKGDMRAQLRQVGENLKAALAAAGATLDDLVQTSTFVTDWAAFRQALDVRHEYLGASLPTSTTVQVSGLANPDLMIEISAIAMVEA